MDGKKAIAYSSLLEQGWRVDLEGHMENLQQITVSSDLTQYLAQRRY